MGLPPQGEGLLVITPTNTLHASLHPSLSFITGHSGSQEYTWGLLSTAAPAFWQRHISESACHDSFVVMLLFVNDFLIALKTKWRPAPSQV